MLMVFIYPFLSRGRYRKNRIFKHALIHTYKRKFFSFCLKLHRKPKGTSFLLVLKYFLKRENNKTLFLYLTWGFWDEFWERLCRIVKVYAGLRLNEHWWLSLFCRPLYTKWSGCCLTFFGVDATTSWVQIHNYHFCRRTILIKDGICQLFTI